MKRWMRATTSVVVIVGAVALVAAAGLGANRTFEPHDGPDEEVPKLDPQSLARTSTPSVQAHVEELRQLVERNRLSYTVGHTSMSGREIPRAVPTPEGKKRTAESVR